MWTPGCLLPHSVLSSQLHVQFSTDSRVQKMFEILLDENSESDKLEKVSAAQPADQQRAHAGRPHNYTSPAGPAPISGLLLACWREAEGVPLEKVNKNRAKVKHLGKFPHPG